MRADGLKQVVGAGHVAFQEHPGTGDGAIHVAFRGQVQHQIGVRLLDGLLHSVGIGEFNVQQLMATGRRRSLLVQHGLDPGEIAGVAHFVEVEHQGVAFQQQPTHHGPADEAAATGDQNPVAPLQQLSGSRHRDGHEGQEGGMALRTARRASRQCSPSNSSCLRELLQSRSE